MGVSPQQDNLSAPLTNRTTRAAHGAVLWTHLSVSLMSDRPAVRSAVCPTTAVWPTVKTGTTQLLLLHRADERFSSTLPAEGTANLPAQLITCARTPVTQ
jgi:hypothetical protein